MIERQNQFHYFIEFNYFIEFFVGMLLNEDCFGRCDTSTASQTIAKRYLDFRFDICCLFLALNWFNAGLQ